MSYNISIPNVTDFLAISQKQILANYQAINNVFSQNHVPLTSIRDKQGQHTSLTLRPQSGDPTTTASQSALYNKLVTGVPQVFFRPNNNQTPIQMTNSNSSNTSAPGTLRQSTFVPGPFTVYVGIINNVPNNTTVTLTPVTTLVYVGLGTYIEGRIGTIIGIAAPVNISGNQFTIRFENGLTPDPVHIYYFAIGST